MAVGPLLLLIEDDEPLRRSLRLALLDEDFRVVEAATGADALRQVAAGPDAVLLDIVLPDVDGIALCPRIRSTTGVPIVVISARHAPGDVARALAAGADDYLGKPFLAADLARRVRALLRPARILPSSVVPGVGKVELGVQQDTILVDDRKIPMSRTELRLLCELMAESGRTVGRLELLQGVWGFAPAAGDGVLESRIGSLRDRLADAGSTMTISGSGGGYRLEART